ncbi:hypothetical protein J6590_066795 [Homalodisca vitripennis]|nr:hypothetical protein J6590_066795 [Homalodisca vitripennis]
MNFNTAGCKDNGRLSEDGDGDRAAASTPLCQGAVGTRGGSTPPLSHLSARGVKQDPKKSATGSSKTKRKVKRSLTQHSYAIDPSLHIYLCVENLVVPPYLDYYIVVHSIMTLMSKLCEKFVLSFFVTNCFFISSDEYDSRFQESSLRQRQIPDSVL